MNSFRLTNQAQSDIHESWSHIADNSPGAADHWAEVMYDKFMTIAQHPGMGREQSNISPNLRSFVVGNYIIFYRAVANGIEVVRVLHGARNIEELF